jgi:hypothetical protein
VALQWDKQPASRVTKTQTLAYTNAAPACSQRHRWIRNAAVKIARAASYASTCGILEQAYRQLREQGVPLVKEESVLADTLITKQYERWKDLEYQWQRAWSPDASKTSRKEPLGS